MNVWSVRRFQISGQTNTETCSIQKQKSKKYKWRLESCCWQMLISAEECVLCDYPALIVFIIFPAVTDHIPQWHTPVWLESGNSVALQDGRCVYVPWLWWRAFDRRVTEEFKPSSLSAGIRNLSEKTRACFPRLKSVCVSLRSYWLVVYKPDFEQTGPVISQFGPRALQRGELCSHVADKSDVLQTVDTRSFTALCSSCVNGLRVKCKLCRSVQESCWANKYCDVIPPPD